MSAATAKPEETPSATPTDAPAPPTTASAPSASAPAPTTSTSSASPFHSASLYIGDLLPEVNEGLLFEIFNAVGPVASIRVCRDAVTRRSLGYAYVNYHQISDAERALDSMNFTDIKGKPCRIMWSQRDPSVRRSGVGNIFVKNLHEGIDNKQLYDTFSLFGNILSCKVVCDRETGKSKGYGYVHYETHEAAKNAIEKLDGMLIDGKEVQVGVFMRRDNRPGVNDFTNCFIKNLPLDWTEDKLKEEFSKFGEIVSASISMGVRKKKPAKKEKKAAPAAPDDEESKEEASNAEGDSTTKEGEDKPALDAADTASEEKTESKEESSDSKKEEDAPPSEESKEQEQEQSPPTPSSLGFGFVNFSTHEAAVAAIEAMNDKEITCTDPDSGETITRTLFVGRAQKKSERQQELRAKYEAEKMDRIAKFQGVNLYVKNLDDSVSDDTLREEFSTMGTITSARVMRDLKSGVSRGFGFVCYSTPEDATRAVNEMNGKLIAGKPIFVALAQRRDVRRAQLEAQHNQARGGAGGNPPGQPGMMRGPMAGPMGGYPGAAGVPVYMPRPGPGGMQPSYPMVPQMMGVQGGRGGYGMQGSAAGAQPGRPGYPMPGYGMMPAQPGRGGRGPVPGRAGRGGVLPGRMGPQGVPGGRGPMNGPAGRGGGPGQPPQQGGGPIKFNQQARNAGPNHGGNAPPNQGGGAIPPQPSGGAPPAPQPSASEQLTPAALASASPEMQKNMIGERLYPLIHQTQPELAGKITGMLLEMDNSELLHLLESPEALGAKIHEALQVLEAHNAAANN